MRRRFADIIRSSWPARCAVFLLISASVLFADPSVVIAQKENKCEIPVKYRKKWSEPEQWAWNRICKEEVADFNGRPGNQELNPRTPAHDDLWAKGGRTLSRRFLRTILLKEPFRSAVSGQGVRIAGAYFEDRVNLYNAQFEHSLSIEKSFFKLRVDMDRLTTPEFVSLSGSRFMRTLDMDSATIGRNLSIENTQFDNIVLLKNVKIKGKLNMRGSIFWKKVRMKSAEIGGDLYIDDTLFNDRVYLEGAIIGGKLDMRDSIFCGRIDMEFSKIGGDLLMQKTRFEKFADFVSLRVGSKLDMRGATLSGLDLTKAQIKDELRLGPKGSKNIEWKGSAPKLILRNTTVGTLRDSENAWHDKMIIDNLGILLCTEVGILPCTKKAWVGATKQLDLELEGFTYKPFGKAGRSVFDMRDSDWFVGWLAKDKTYSPQPYLYLASHLRAARRGEMADEILLSSRERERGLYNPWQSKWWVLLALKIGINYGYGLGYFLLLRFIVLFVVIGTVVLHIAGERKRHHYMIASFWDSAFYSLDMLLPLIRLRERHYTEIDLNRGARYYFYFHQVVGYLLVSIMLAELLR